MKPILKAIYIILAIFMLATCIPKTEEKVTQKAEAEKPTQVAKADAEMQEEKAEPKKTPEELAEEARQKKIEEYEEKLKNLSDELYEKGNAIKKKSPALSPKLELEKGILRSDFYASYDKPEYIRINNIEKEESFYSCKQKRKIKNDDILEYKIKFKEAGKDGERRICYSPNINLITKINIGNVNDKIIEEQVHGEVYDLKKDENSETMIKIFEKYENENYPNEEYDLGVIDYVKVNLTGSKYDEYFVMFYEKDGRHLVQGFALFRLRCFVVMDKKIIKDYYINGPRNRAVGFYGDDFSYHFEKIKNFGYLFSQGWVNDFNQNGINEIYLASRIILNYPALFIIEFDGNKFITDYVSTHNYKVKSVNWKTKTILTKGNECLDHLESIWIPRQDAVQWDADIKEFVLKERNYTIKEEGE